MAEKKSSYFIIIFLVVLVAIGIGFFLLTRTPEGAPSGVPGAPAAPSGGVAAPSGPVSPARKAMQAKKEPTVVKEQLKIPVTKKITTTAGRTVDTSEEKVETPLVPQTIGEQVIVSLATYTVKGVYDVSLKEAKQWKSDVKLSFVKSLGAITLEGKSSQWQVAFVAASAPKKSYEVIVQGDAVVSKKEIESTAVGADLPKTWFDSDEALKRLAALPQFVNATVSGINFFYNPDAKLWRYGIATSVGATSLEL